MFFFSLRGAQLFTLTDSLTYKHGSYIQSEITFSCKIRFVELISCNSTGLWFYSKNSQVYEDFNKRA